MIKTKSKKAMSFVITLVMIFTMVLSTAMTALAADYDLHMASFGSPESAASTLGLDYSKFVDGNYKDDKISLTFNNNKMVSASIFASTDYNANGIYYGDTIDNAIHKTRFIAKLDSTTQSSDGKTSTAKLISTIEELSNEVMLLEYNSSTKIINKVTVVYDMTAYTSGTSSNNTTTSATSAAPTTAKEIQEMFYGYWKFEPEYAVKDGVKYAITNSSYDIILNEDKYYDAINETSAVANYEYKVITAKYNDPDYQYIFGDGYYLVVALDFDDGNYDYLSVLWMDKAYSGFIRQTNIFVGEDFTPNENGNPEPKFVKPTPKTDVTYNIGDKVKKAGLLDIFRGEVKDVNGDQVLVYWYDITDIWGASEYLTYSSKELAFAENLAGVRVFETSWVNKADIYK